MKEPEPAPQQLVELLFRLAYYRDVQDWPGIRVSTPDPITGPSTTLHVVIGERGTRFYTFSAPLTLDPDELRDWAGYRLDAHGVVVDGDAPGDARTWTLTLRGSAPQRVHMWRQIAQYQDSPLYAEQLWLAGEPERCAIRGLEQEHNEDDIARARTGLRLLRRLEPLPVVAGMSATEIEELFVDTTANLITNGLPHNQEDVGIALGYSPRRIRELCQVTLGRRAWQAVILPKARQRAAKR